MEAFESDKADRAISNRRWGLQLLVGGVIVAIGNDLWELFRRAVEVAMAILF